MKGVVADLPVALGIFGDDIGIARCEILGVPLLHLLFREQVRSPATWIVNVPPLGGIKLWLDPIRSTEGLGWVPTKV